MTKYYRHNDPRRGFKLHEELQIVSQERIKFMDDIEKLNEMYRQCADKHSQCFLSQPNENEILQKISMLLMLPVLICYACDAFAYLVELYVLAVGALTYYIVQYLYKVNACRQDFSEANEQLRVQFRQLQQSFEQRWPHNMMVLQREWNQNNESCVEYIEISPKSQINNDNKENVQPKNQESVQYRVM